MPEAARRFDSVNHTTLTDKLVEFGVEKSSEEASKFVAKEALKGTLILSAKTIVGKDIILGTLLNVGVKFGAKGINFFVKSVAAVPALTVEMFKPNITDTQGIINGSDNVLVNMRGAARFLDSSECDKHIKSFLSPSESKVYINKLPAVRRGDLLKCGAIVTGGSENVFFDEISLQLELAEILRQLELAELSARRVPPQPLPAPTENPITDLNNEQPSSQHPVSQQPLPQPLPTPTVSPQPAFDDGDFQTED